MCRAGMGPAGTIMGICWENMQRRLCFRNRRSSTCPPSACDAVAREPCSFAQHAPSPHSRGGDFPVLSASPHTSISKFGCQGFSRTGAPGTTSSTWSDARPSGTPSVAPPAFRPPGASVRPSDPPGPAPPAPGNSRGNSRGKRARPPSHTMGLALACNSYHKLGAARNGRSRSDAGRQRRLDRCARHAIRRLWAM